jgi:hypothetical protein
VLILQTNFSQPPKVIFTTQGPRIFLFFFPTWGIETLTHQFNRLCML